MRAIYPEARASVMREERKRALEESAECAATAASRFQRVGFRAMTRSDRDTSIGTWKLIKDGPRSANARRGTVGPALLVPEQPLRNAIHCQRRRTVSSLGVDATPRSLRRSAGRGKGREPVRARRSFGLAFRHATEPPCRKRVARTRMHTRARALVRPRAAVQDATRNNVHPVAMETSRKRFRGGGNGREKEKGREREREGQLPREVVASLKGRRE